MTFSLRRLVALLALIGGAALAQENVPGPPPEVLRMQECYARQTETIERAIRQIRLPVTLSYWRLGAVLNSQCELTGPVDLEGDGTVRAEVVEHALLRAGLEARVELNTAPYPQAQISTSIWPLQIDVLPIGNQKIGSTLTARIHIQNLTFFRQVATWGGGVVHYVLFDQGGNIVRWDENRLIALVEYGCELPPMGICTRLTGSVPLDRFNPDLPLEPGHYTLRFSLDRLGMRGRELSTTLPDLPFDILP
jgi:hypothetical protein